MSSAVCQNTLFRICNIINDYCNMIKDFCNKRPFQTSNYPKVNRKVFVTGSNETAKPNRSIPLSLLYAKFIRNENISDYVSSSLSFNPLEDNPFKRRGLDLADLPAIKQEVHQATTTASDLYHSEKNVAINDDDSTTTIQQHSQSEPPSGGAL